MRRYNCLERVEYFVCFSVLCRFVFNVIAIFLAILPALLVPVVISMTSKAVMTMDFVVTLSDKLKLARHGPYAGLWQLPDVYSFIEEKNY